MPLLGTGLILFVADSVVAAVVAGSVVAAVVVESVVAAVAAAVKAVVVFAASCLRSVAAARPVAGSVCCSLAVVFATTAVDWLAAAGSV